MTIEPGSAPGLVSATFSHTCGHQSSPMAYGGEQYAKNDQARQESTICWSCHNSREIARLTRTRQETQPA